MIILFLLLRLLYLPLDITQAQGAVAQLLERDIQVFVAGFVEV